MFVSGAFSLSSGAKKGLWAEVDLSCSRLTRLPPVSQCRLRGKLDTNGVVGALLEERLNVGVNLLISAEVGLPFTHP